MRPRLPFLALAVSLVAIPGCGRAKEEPSGRGQSPVLRGAASYTPYDAIAMLWSRGQAGRDMVWVSSGAEAGQLLVSAAGSPNRPDWVLCTQGVVAGLAARDADVQIIATVYVSSDVILPVFRKPRRQLAGLRSLFIPRSSIELAFDRLLAREGVDRSTVRVPAVEKPGFASIVSLLQKPPEDRDAIDFAILVDPFITNLLAQNPNGFDVGPGGLYEMHYSVVIRGSDLRTEPARFATLLRQLLEADERLRSLPSDEAFTREVWGRDKDGQPERLPGLRTYARGPARLQLNISRLRQLLDEEISYLTSKYPDQLRTPHDTQSLVNGSVLEQVSPDRVTR